MRSLAIAGPLLLIGLWSSRMLAPLESSQPGIAQEAIGTALAGDDPIDLLLIGNSMLGAAIDQDQLAAGLGIDRARVARINLYSSRSAETMMVIDSLDSDDEVGTIAVANALSWILDTSEPEGRRLEYLRDLGGESNPVLADKVFRQSSWLRRLRTRRETIRHRTFEGIRNLGVCATVIRCGDDEGRDEIEENLESVFADENLREASRRILPIAEVRERRRRLDQPFSIDQTLLPELLAAARRAESRLILLRMPHSRGSGFDEVDLERVSQVIAWCNDNGVGWIDLNDQAFTDLEFHDDRHLNNHGRGIATAVLIDEIEGLGGLDASTPLASAETPVQPPTVTRSGRPPALEIDEIETIEEDCLTRFQARAAVPTDSQLSRFDLRIAAPFELSHDGRRMPPQTFKGCEEGYALRGSGVEVRGPEIDPGSLSFSWREEIRAEGREAYWLLPETTLEIDLGPSITALDDETLEILFYRLGRGEIDVTRGDSKATLGGETFHIIDTPASTEQRIEIRSRAASATGLLLGIRRPSGRLILGTDTIAQPPRVDIVAKRIDTTSLSAPAPPTIPQSQRITQVGSRLELFLDPALAIYAEPLTSAIGTAVCNPLRVRHPDWPALVPIRADQVSNKSGFYQQGSLLVANGPSVLDLQTPPRLELEENRWCLNQRFGRKLLLYPGDELRIDLVGRQKRRLPDGIGSIRAKVATLKADDVIEIQLLGTDRSLATFELGPGATTLSIEALQGADAVSLANPSSSLIVVEHLTLVNIARRIALQE